MAGSDFSRSCIIGYGSSPSRCGPTGTAQAVDREISRFPCTKSVHACQCLRPRRIVQALALARPTVLPSAAWTASASEARFFRGSMAGLHAPLSTLRARPRSRPRMTRGRCGSLLLHRSGLAPPTPCRFNRRTHANPARAIPSWDRFDEGSNLWLDGIKSACPSRPRCRPCGWRSPTRCRTRTARAPACPPSPWSGRCGTRRSGCRG